MSEPLVSGPGPETGPAGPDQAAEASPGEPPQRTGEEGQAPAGSPPGGGTRRRRGSRGGRRRRSAAQRQNDLPGQAQAQPDGAEMPGTGNPSTAEVVPTPAERSSQQGGPRIGDTRPAPTPPPPLGLPARPPAADLTSKDSAPAEPSDLKPEEATEASPRRRRRRGGRGRGRPSGQAVEPESQERRRGRERRGRPVGRYLMCVHVRPHAAQVAVLEGRSLIEHYVSRPQDDASEIDGNIYLGKVQNVLPGMEAAFVDIGTPKNAVLYRGDVYYDKEDVEGGSSKSSGDARIEQLLRQGQTILCQVTKNPIGSKGARLTQEVSLPGRFAVLVPNSDTYGISKRLDDDERRRLRRILDDIRPKGHGLIVRTAAEGATASELRRDVQLLVRNWAEIDAAARNTPAPALLYAEPDMAVRVIREEFNGNYRGVVIDDRQLYEQVRDYVTSITPDLADRVEFYDTSTEPLPLFERNHIHEQLHKALDRKVWLPSGGSIIIERTEALTVIDVNTGKNVGTSSLEETVYRNNCEAAEEIARQLRLRDIGGIIVIDFIDMEVKASREGVMKVFREALARDKTRTQVFEMSELGLVQMTRKRVSEGLVESFSQECPACSGRGIVFDESLL